MIVQETDGRYTSVNLTSVTPRRYVGDDGRRFIRQPGRSDHGKHTKSDARLTKSSLKRLEAGNTSGQVH